MLPERRKSAEEIAKLRESMGIPGAASVAAEEAPAAGASLPAESVPAHGKLPAVGDEPASGEATFNGLAPGQPAGTLLPGTPKPVRSLRKSEQKVVERTRAAVPAAAIPARRHSDDELMEMRRIQATPPDRSIARIQQLAVPWPVIALGYVLPLCGAVGAWFAVWSPGVPPLDFPAEWIARLSRQPWLAKAGLGTLGLFCGSAFALAGWIAWKKPRSHHHAGFISIITLLVLVFGILQLTSTHGP